ncbi:hypothetical protein ACB094_06G169200 [Castanea mollissima]
MATQTARVLFAEADKEFIDFLFHILRFSLGTIIPLLKKQGMVPLLLPDNESSTSKTLYRRSRIYNNSCYSYVADDSNAKCPSCEASMRKKVSFVDPPSVTNTGSSGGGGYVKGVVTYMIMDYLEVKPMSTISSITLHSKLNVKHMGALEEKVVELGMDEGVKLLKASLQSKSVLTDVFLPKLEQQVNKEI